MLIYSQWSYIALLYAHMQPVVLYSDYCMLLCSQSYIATTVCSYAASGLYIATTAHMQPVVLYSNYCMLISASGLI